MSTLASYFWFCLRIFSTVYSGSFSLNNRGTALPSGSIRLPNSLLFFLHWARTIPHQIVAVLFRTMQQIILARQLWSFCVNCIGSSSGFHRGVIICIFSKAFKLWLALSINKYCFENAIEYFFQCTSFKIVF